MSKPMDRICVNCEQRFGAHFGDGNYVFCSFKTYTIYKDSGEMISNKMFIDSGQLQTKEGEYYTIKDMTNDPNTLFKRKKRDVLR